MEKISRSLVLEPMEAQNDLEEVIDRIVAIIMRSKIIDNIIGLFLGGGFGRGEGSVVLSEGKYHTSNDFDLFALAKNDINDKYKKAIEKEIESTLGLKDCGIDMIDFQRLCVHCQSGHLSQSLFDFLKGNILLWKNPRYNDDMCLFNSYIEKNYCINISSSYDVLRTRSFCLIAPFDFTGDCIKVDEAYKGAGFAYFQTVKAATAIVDAVLIAENKYSSPCFKDKLTAFNKSRFSKKRDVSIITFLIQAKIHNHEPVEIDSMIIEKMISLYNEAVQFVVMRKIASYIWYLATDNIRMLYVRHVKHIDMKRNYSLKLVRIAKNYRSQRSSIQAIQENMRKAY